MEIYLDDESVAVADAEAMTIDQLAQAVRSQFNDPGRLITTIRCDGHTIDPATLGETLRQKAGAYGRIEFQSSDLGELTRAALRGAGDLIDQCDQTRQEAADALVEGQSAKAMELLGLCFNSWGRAHDSIIKCAEVLDIDVAAVAVGDVPIQEWCRLLRSKLEDLRDALTVGDHVLVADILRYEFDEVSAGWKSVIARLMKKAEAA